MENLVYLFSCFLSCVIIAGLMFQFMGDRYEKAFVNPWVYRIAAAAAVVFVTLINLKRNALWNAAVNFSIYGIISFFFYEDRSNRRYWRVLEASCFFLTNQAEPDAGISLSCYVYLRYSQYFDTCNSSHKESGLFLALC